jgi:hypothetical protein
MALSLEQTIREGEGEALKFKSTLRWDLEENAVNKSLEGNVVKAVAAFGNSQGGSLLVGVSDDGQICGLENDYRSMQGNRDKFERYVRQLIIGQFGEVFASRKLQIVFHASNASDVCQVLVHPATEPLIVRSTDKNGQPIEKFYIRSGNASRELPVSAMHAYIQDRFVDVRRSAPSKGRSIVKTVVERIDPRARQTAQVATPIPTIAPTASTKRPATSKSSTRVWNEASFLAQAEEQPSDGLAAIRRVCDWATRSATVKFSGTKVGGFNVSFPRIYPGTIVKLGGDGSLNFRFGRRKGFGSLLRERIEEANFFKMGPNSDPTVKPQDWTPVAGQLTEVIDAAVRDYPRWSTGRQSTTRR